MVTFKEEKKRKKTVVMKNKQRQETSGNSEYKNSLGTRRNTGVLTGGGLIRHWGDYFNTGKPTEGRINNYKGEKTDRE